MAGYLKFITINGPLALMVLFFGLAFLLLPAADVTGRETIVFSGYTWETKHHIRSTMGPGPNYWSASGWNVRVDESGNLHLKIVENKGRWYASEVRLDKALGYGTYEFTVVVPDLPLDKNVVLGMFNYLDDRKEFDIEISRWRESSRTDIQFVVQPSEQDRNIKRFPLEAREGSKKVLSYTWTRNELHFRYEDCSNQTCSQRELVEGWTYRGDDLPRDDLKTHINLWLVDGNPPSDGEEVEVILEDFTFTALDEDSS
ncbi:hypothetical protein KGY71_07505 [Candidatus Bipolaricaulota bacterium]|nr:hypothetical protein [Candidatus Bipolaricaulota bacterium]